MKRFLLLFLFSAAALGQHRIPPIDLYNGDPTGNACTVPNAMLQSSTTGKIYSCLSGVYVSAGGTGSGTVNAGQLALPKYPTSSAPSISPSNFTYDAATGNNLTIPGTSFSASVFSGSINGVYDLKAAFGASGSNQSITCTATSGNSTMTGCSAGDFKTGQEVFIPQAGTTPSISTPSSITATCGSDNSGSCTGSTVYGYQVVAVQGIPNGEMTAASTPVTVTQGTQSKRAATNSSWGDVYTTLAIGSSTTNVSAWLVYKSINSSPYNFYTVVYASGGINTTWKDFGDMSANLFTCVDIGVPCTAPASAVPNDVYAKISSITGNSGNQTIVLATRSSQPNFRGLPGLSGPYPSQPSVNGTVTVQHDDTTAFYNVWTTFRGLSSGGQVKIHIPAGNYLTHPEASDGYYAVIRASGLHNVLFEGDGDASYIYESNDRAVRTTLFMRSECGDAAGFGCRSYRVGQNVGSGTAYTLNDPVSVGSTAVTLATPAQASNFPAGTYVTIYNNATPYPYTDYGEINLVTASDTTTGIVSLKYPTDKMYSATLNVAPYSQCSSCQATPSMTPMVGGVSASNISMRNFRVYSPNSFYIYNATDNVTIDNMTITASYFSQNGSSRNVRITNNRVTEDGYWAGSGMVVGAQADGDFTVTGNTYRSVHAFGTAQNCTEGSANFYVANNTMEYANPFTTLVDTGGQSPNTGSLIDWGSGCFNFQFINNRIRVGNSGIYTVMLALDLNASATITGNDIYVDGISSSSNAASVAFNAQLGTGVNPYANIYNNLWTSGNGNGNNGGLQVSGSSINWAGLKTFTLAATSGGIGFFPNMGQATINIINMSGNVTGINLGSTRVPGLYFAFDFVQPGGGGITIPSDCTNAKWVANGSGIDCPNGPPVANPAANSSTLVWLYDDGTTVHFVSSNYATLPSTVVQTNQTNTYSTGTQDFHSAAHTLSFKSGTTASLPGTCTTGEEYFATDATAGSNIFLCTATNVWTQVVPSGAGVVTSVPLWLQFFGDGSESAPNCTSGCTVAGEHWYASFNLPAGQTMITNSATQATIIRSPGTCTIAGTASVSANTGGSTGISVATNMGASSGGGGFGASNGAGGNASSPNGGGGAGTSGVAGGNGLTINAGIQKMFLSAGFTFGAVSTGNPVAFVYGGAAGVLGQGNSTVAKGGGMIVFACNVINFTGTIDASGQNGGAGGLNIGGNSPGAGGIVIMRSPNFTNSGTINVAAGSVGAAGTGTSTASGSSGNGWSYVNTH